MTEFLRAKTWLLNAIWHGVYETGDQFDTFLEAIQTCETPEQLARVERWALRVHAGRVAVG